MNDLLSSLWTGEVQFVFAMSIVLLLILYVLSIVWVARDAYLRGAPWVAWCIVAIIPIAGVIAYCFMRPHMYRIDQDEQELEIALKQRQLQQYGECGNCAYPVQADYVLCPNCHTRLKNLCPTCGRALEPQWTICPYCATQVGMAQQRRAQQRRTTHVQSRSNNATQARTKNANSTKGNTQKKRTN